MKNKILLAFTLLITLSKSYGQLEMSSNGNIGVGNIPLSSYKLNIHGDTYFRPFGSESKIIIDQYEEEALIGTTDNIYGYIGTPNKQFWKIYSRYVYSNGVLLTSDKRKKENIKYLNSKICLEKITKIKSTEYNFKQNVGLNTNKSTTKKKLDLHKKEFGFLAQDLQNIIPEAVEYDLKNDDYYVNYTAIIPLLVESIKEQEKTIQKLNRKINKLEKKVVENESLSNISKNKNSLGQNTPNPFDKETVISLFLEKNTVNAILYIRDFDGNPSGEYSINERGETSITIKANTLKSGIYFYSLIVDGKLVKTKRMLIL